MALEVLHSSTQNGISWQVCLRPDLSQAGAQLVMEFRKCGKRGKLLDQVIGWRPAGWCSAPSSKIPRYLLEQIPLLEIKGQLQHLPGDRLHQEAAPAGNQLPRLGGGQGIGPRDAGGLHVELLQDLDGEGPVIVLEQQPGKVPLAPLGLAVPERVQQNFGLREATGSHRARSGAGVQLGPRQPITRTSPRHWASRRSSKAFWNRLWRAASAS